MTNYTNFKIETDSDGIALVTWDMPEKSMNVFTQEVMEELNAIVDQTTADAAVKGVVFTSGKSSFSGGADLSMIKSMFTFQQEEKKKDPDNAAQKLFDLVGRMTGLFRKLETSGKPWVSAINGTCMGGAFELSLACHGRVASNSKSVKIALPEVKVGIFPGAGGTQRVPRLTNAQDALQMMTTGSSLTAARAKAMGLVHEVVDADKLVDAAKAMIKNGLKPVQPWDEKGYKVPGGGIWTPASAQLWPAASGILRRETYGNYPGAVAILKCVYEGLQVPFDTALKIEQRYFTEILQTTEAFSMIRSLFVSMQELGKGARRPAGVPKSEFKHVGVVGAGFMGASIAYVTAAAGIAVTLIDRDMEAAEKGKAHSEGLVKDSVGKGRLTKEEGEALLARIMMASTKPGDVILDPFFGSGTTGAVAKRLGRHFVGIEREQDYIDAASARIAAVEPLGKAELTVMTGKKAEPRVAFNTLVESGLVRPGQVLTDVKRRYSAIIRADGTLASAGTAGSIHRLGAKVQGLDACNGWTFWHFEDGDELKPIDDLRTIIRSEMAKAE